MRNFLDLKIVIFAQLPLRDLLRILLLKLSKFKQINPTEIISNHKVADYYYYGCDDDD